MTDSTQVLTLFEWRKAKGYTQASFARKLGVSVTTYNDWENDPGMIKIANAVRIANALDVPIDNIIFSHRKSYLKYGIRVRT
ncbi:helix-turn-helix transcriptional regulator [Staphylococcus chromogenes]|uniref:helix-turn-helix domain-containing protein n=1 Tax=Staphylococcus chromogenes TaxID=46126 RepID=UPI003B00176A